MTKVSFKNFNGLTLVGSLWSTASDAIIIMTHGSGSNRRARGLFEKIAVSLQASGYAVLAFDFSGHGESDDVIFSLKQSVDDLASAVAFVKQQGYKRIGFLGHSLGAFACLSHSHDAQTMVLLGGLTGPVDWDWKDMVSQDQLEAMKKTGYISADVNDGLRKTVRINAQLLDEIRTIDQEKVMKQVSYPMLMIHGDADQQELDLLVFSKKALDILPEGSKLEVIPGANHSFLDHSLEVVSLATQWFMSYLPIKKG